jgi:hypothetical protein
VVAGMLLVPGTGWAACSRPRNIAVRVSVQAAEIAVRADYSLADLAHLAGAVSQHPRHQVLGFYANTVGFTLNVPALDTADVTIDVQLIAQERVIELARDLDGCLSEVALKHYRHHAALHAEALAQSGHALQSALRAIVVDQASSGALRDRVRAFVDQWLDGFQTMAPSLQTAADSPAELDALRHACST